MSDKKMELTAKSQVHIELACMVAAILLWVVLLALAGFSSIFLYVLLGYNIVGGFFNRDIAKSMFGAILLAPIYVGKKIALGVQTAQVNEKFNHLTKENLLDLNSYIVDFFKEHRGKGNDELLNSFIFGCSTYGELAEFNRRITKEYEKRKN